ncbi:MAG: heavy-metal-associated domain-containing protein [Alistipes sp.]|nr:heavy-metal-associated domain-containing protein [Alistipes sp.]
MKKLAMLCLALVLGAGLAQAAKPAAEKKTVTTVFCTDIHCDHCANKIMNNVPSLGKGIEEVAVDVQTKEVTVTYDAAKNTDANIVKGLATLKVKAAPKPAEPTK